MNAYIQLHSHKLINKYWTSIIAIVVEKAFVKVQSLKMPTSRNSILGKIQTNQGRHMISLTTQPSGIVAKKASVLENAYFWH